MIDSNIKGTTVMIADDDGICLFGLDLLCQQIGLNVIGTYSKAEDLLAALDREVPELVIIDEVFANGGMAGSKAIETIRRKWPTILTISITCHQQPARLERIWKSGVHGLCNKHRKDDLIDTIKAVLNLERYADGHSSQMLRQASSMEILKMPHAEEILCHVAEGKTNEDIGKQLDLSPATVNKYINNMYELCDVHSKAQLTSYALDQGIIDPIVQNSGG